MKKIFTLIGITLCLFNAQKTFGLKPVAQSIQKMHDLNISFRYYELFSNASTTLDETILQSLSGGTSAELNLSKLSGLLSEHPEAIKVLIPFKGTTIIVELIKSNIFTDDFTVVTGDNQSTQYSPGIYYSGIIQGDPNSIAAFSFFEKEAYGILSDEINGNINIGRLLDAGNISDYIIYAESSLLKMPSNICHTLDDYTPLARQGNSSQINSLSNTNKCVRLYYEVDYDLYQDNGSSVVNTTNWMTAVHNNIATLFTNDNISVALSQIYVWSSADPYTGNNSSDQLQTFRTTRPSFNGDAGQLMASDGGYGGLGYLEALCSSFNYAYADIDFAYSNVPTYSWTVEASTHEFGHVLGSPHTHNCGWPVGALDDCYATEGGCAAGPTPVNGGTIMSYCHLGSTGINFINGFGTYPGDTIEHHVNNSSCLGSSCAVCPVPAHNSCNTPSVLSITSNCVYIAGNFCGATESIAPILCSGVTAVSAKDVWYSVIPVQSSMIVNCQSGTTTDVVLVLYSGTCGSLTLINCSDATSTNGLETITATVIPGNTYYLRVYDYSGNTTGTDFGICVSQNCVGSTNNGCSTSSTLTIGTSCSFTNGDLCSATQSMSPSTCSGFTSGDAFDLWYRITPTQPNVKITCQSGIATDIILGIYSGSCGSLTLVNCVDMTSAGGPEILNVTLSTGSTYYIRVYDWTGNLNGTDYQICAEYICTTPTAPVNATATATTICSGSSTTLNVTGTLSAGATWHWYRNSCGGIAVDTGTSVNVSPTSSTTYYVRAQNGTCFSTCRNVTVTVTAIPANPTTAVALPSAVCQGSATSLTVNGTLSAGASWQWYADSCGGTSGGSGANISVTPTNATTYYVRAVNGNCFSNCVNTTVTINIPPNDPDSINTSTQLVCSGDSAMLMVNGTLSGGAAWQWYANTCGGSSIATGATAGIITNTATTYFVRAEDNNCNSNCLSISIGTHPPTAQPTVTVIINQLSVPVFNNYQWYWSVDGLIFSTSGNAQQQIATIDGFYFVIVTDVNGCTVSSDTVLYQDPSAIVENDFDELISIYPNPTNENLNISIHSDLNKNIELKIFDTTGRLLYESPLIEKKLNTIDFTRFASGLYQLLFSIDDVLYLQKVLKE